MLDTDEKEQLNGGFKDLFNPNPLANDPMDPEHICRKTTFAFERRYASLYFIVVASVFVLSDEKKRLHPVKRFFLNSPL